MYRAGEVRGQTQLQVVRFGERVDCFISEELISHLLVVGLKRMGDT